MNVNSDPFAEVRISSLKPTYSNIPERENDQAMVEDPFSSVRMKEVSGFPGLSEIGRHATRTASRIAETIGGIPGDLSSLLQSGVLYGLEKLKGFPFSEEKRELIKSSPFPTSQSLKNASKSITSGYTSPHSQAEKSADELVETASSLFGPMKFRKALGVAVGSQAAKEGTKLLGLEEDTQEAAKLGSMLMLSVLNPGGAMKYASSQFKKADDLAKGASVTASGLENGIKSFIENLSKGVDTPGKSAVIRPAEQLLSKIKNGKIPVEELTAAKRDVNTLMGDPNLLKRERKLFKHLGKEIDKSISVYEKINPTFSKAYRPANQIFGTVMQGQKASNFISKALGTKSVVGAALAEAALGHPEMILPTIGTAGAIIGAGKSVDFISRVVKSPELRKFYMKALMAGVKEDVGALRLNAKKIEDYLDKE